MAGLEGAHPISNHSTGLPSRDPSHPPHTFAHIAHDLAGEALDQMHAGAMYSRALEAAFAGRGYNMSDVPAFQQSLTEITNRFEKLHQVGWLGGCREGSALC